MSIGGSLIGFSGVATAAPATSPIGCGSNGDYHICWQITGEGLYVNSFNGYSYAYNNAPKMDGFVQVVGPYGFQNLSWSVPIGPSSSHTVWSIPLNQDEPAGDYCADWVSDNGAVAILIPACYEVKP